MLLVFVKVVVVLVLLLFKDIVDGFGCVVG